LVFAEAFSSLSRYVSVTDRVSEVLRSLGPSEAGLIRSGVHRKAAAAAARHRRSTPAPGSRMTIPGTRVSLYNLQEIQYEDED